MSAALTPFAFDDALIRVRADENGAPWFVGKDVARALEYAEISNPARLFSHVPDEWKGVNPIHTLGGIQEMLCISEQGLYFFVARSDKPKALPFQKWLASEVLPAIRKTGGYGLPGYAEPSLRLRPALREKALSSALQSARLIGASSEDEIDRLYVKYCTLIAGDGASESLLDADVGQFLDERYEFEPRARIAAGELYAAFLSWHGQNKGGPAAVSAKRFAEALNRRDIPAKRSNGSWRLGLRLKNRA